MKRIIAVQEEPSLHVNCTRERCPGLDADTLKLPVDVVSKSFPLCEPIQGVQDCTCEFLTRRVLHPPQRAGSTGENSKLPPYEVWMHLAHANPGGDRTAQDKQARQLHLKERTSPYGHSTQRRRVSMVGQQRQQISELQFDKFPTPSSSLCWKIRFRNQVATCSDFLSKAMLWIKEVEIVDSLDELKMLAISCGQEIPEFRNAGREGRLCSE